jgi:hypothetical protein
MSADLQDAVTLAQELQDLPPQTLAEATLESAINVTCVDLSLATTDQEQREIFDRLRRLHAQRTAVQVMRMERDRGLRKVRTA